MTALVALSLAGVTARAQPAGDVTTAVPPPAPAAADAAAPAVTPSPDAGAAVHGDDRERAATPAAAGAAAPAPASASAMIAPAPVTAAPVVRGRGAVPPPTRAAFAFAPPPPPAELPPPPHLDALDHYVAHDPAAGRAYAMPSALMQKAGTVTLSVRQPSAPVGYVSLSGALADSVELNVGAGYGIGDSETTVIPAFSVKAQLWRSHTSAVALQLGASGKDGNRVGYATALVSTCLGDGCAALLSAHVTAAASTGGDGTVPVFAGASGLFGGDGARLLVEADVVPWDASSRAGALFVGGRFPLGAVALDVGGVAVLVPDSELASPILPALFAGLSVRL